MISKIKYPLSIIKYKIWKFKFEEKTDLNISNKEKEIVKKMRKDGFYIIENFMDLETCKKIISLIDETIVKFPEKIKEDDLKSDQRIWRSENLSPEINNYFNNNFIQNIGEYYSGMKIKIGFTMANKVEFVEKNLGSGGGWHKDAYYSQFKSILYLNNTSIENGSFQFLEKSNKLVSSMIISLKLNKGYPNTRFTNEEIKLLKDYKIKNIAAPAGTLILVDSSLIHRGSPLLKGNRYALTNYYFPINSFENQMIRFNN